MRTRRARQLQYAFALLTIFLSRSPGALSSNFTPGYDSARATVFCFFFSKKEA
jgi:hypothetical protein